MALCIQYCTTKHVAFKKKYNNNFIYLNITLYITEDMIAVPVTEGFSFVTNGYRWLLVCPFPLNFILCHFAAFIHTIIYTQHTVYRYKGWNLIYMKIAFVKGY